MGKQEETKSCMPEKPPSPPRPDQTNVHVYPDWAATQAYYGPRVPLPYYNSAPPPGYPPHPYMWGPPQAMMPPYGSPYAAAYPHGVYAHPAVPLAPTPVSTVETPTKSTADGPKKKLKSLDGFVITASNGNSETAENEGKHRSSESTETEDPSDASDDMGVDKKLRKRSHGGTPLTGGGKTEGGTSSDGGTASAQPLAVGHPKMPREAWMVNEKELKRERRKQSNRESARRSRLRKQAEAEELANRVGALSAENMALTSEISQLAEDSERLRRENALLMEKLKNAEVEKEEVDADAESRHGNGRTLQEVTTENLLSRVNNSGSVVGIVSSEEDEGSTERNLKGGGKKLKQLMDTKPISNGVRAS